MHWRYSWSQGLCMAAHLRGRPCVNDHVAAHGCVGCHRQLLLWRQIKAALHRAGGWAVESWAVLQWRSPTH